MPGGSSDITRPPCFDDKTNTDCPRRYIGCKAECEEWHKWLIVHTEEKAAFQKDLNKGFDADTFLVDQGKRARIDTVRKSAQRRKR